MLLVGLAALPGCGDDGPAPGAGDAARETSGDATPWSDAAAGDAAQGSPDGTVDRSPGALLARLRARVADGRGMADATWERAVGDVAEVLWPSDGSVADRAGAQVHMQLAAVAGEVAGWLAAGPEARAEREASHPVDVEVHDALLAATAGGPEAYRLWCEAEGAALLAKLEAARRARFFPPR